LPSFGVTVAALEALASKMRRFLNEWQDLSFEQQTRRLVMTLRCCRKGRRMINESKEEKPAVEWSTDEAPEGKASSTPASRTIALIGGKSQPMA
jgi:hypothetical protein